MGAVSIPVYSLSINPAPVYFMVAGKDSLFPITRGPFYRLNERRQNFYIGLPQHR